jgi:hypothetical protein
MMVDCSASMEARTQGVSAIDRARAAAAAVASRLSPDSRLTLVRLTAKPTAVFSRFAGDPNFVHRALETISTSPSRANVFAGLTEILASDAYRRPRQTIYLFTDCQVSSWREIKEQGRFRELPTDGKLIVVNVGSNTPLSNRTIAGEPPVDARVVVGLPIVLRPQLVNHSKTEPAHVTMRATVDDREIGQVAVHLKPNEATSQEIIYTPRTPGVQRGRFEISADAFPDDDTFMFTLHVVPAMKIVVVNGFSSPDPFQSESLFVMNALRTEPEGQLPNSPVAGLGPSSDFIRSLDVHEISEAALTAAALDGASVVVLANTGGLNVQQCTWLREFTAGGGGLLIFPGDKVSHETYSKQLLAAPAGPLNPDGGQRQPASRNASRSSAAASPFDPLVDAVLGPPAGDLERSDSFEAFANISFAHPIFSVFGDSNERYFATAQFYRHFNIELPADPVGTWPLAYFRNGEPAIVESRLSRGTVLLTAFPANSKWSNLPLKPEFVPLLLQMVSYAMRPPDASVPSVVPAGTISELIVPINWAPVTGTVIQPNSKSTTIQFERSEGQLTAAFSDTAEKGYYDVKITGGAVEQPRDAVGSFAVNLSPEESDFEMISSDDLHSWFPDSQVSFVDASAQAELAAGKIGEEREVWRSLIAAMLLIIAIEFMLSTLNMARDRDRSGITERIRHLRPSRWAGQMTGGDMDAES